MFTCSTCCTRSCIIAQSSGENSLVMHHTILHRLIPELIPFIRAIDKPSSNNKTTLSLNVQVQSRSWTSTASVHQAQQDWLFIVSVLLLLYMYTSIKDISLNLFSATNTPVKTEVRREDTDPKRTPFKTPAKEDGKVKFYLPYNIFYTFLSIFNP